MELAIDWRDLGKMKVAETFNNAAVHFDAGPLAFWEIYGRRTVEQLHLPPGATVLDVGCGSGAAVLRAAEIVGPQGSVLGIDLALTLLRRGRAKASLRQLTNATFTLGDMTNLGCPERQFDAVLSIFSLFFADNMEKQVSDLWRRVRPGGVLAITTWGPRLFEPVYGKWREFLARESFSLTSLDQPWEGISSPHSLRDLLQRRGVNEVTIISERGSQALHSPEEWWTIVLGSGLRGPIDELRKDAVERLRQVAVDWVRTHTVRAVETNVLYAIARKNRDGCICT